MGMLLARRRMEHTRKMEENAKIDAEKVKVQFGAERVTEDIPVMQAVTEKKQPKSRLMRE